MTDRGVIVEAVSPEQRQLAYSIRFRSYLAIGEIDDRPEPFLPDPYDDEDHYKVFLVTSMHCWLSLRHQPVRASLY